MYLTERVYALADNNAYIDISNSAILQFSLNETLRFYVVIYPWEGGEKEDRRHGGRLERNRSGWANTDAHTHNKTVSEVQRGCFTTFTITIL